MNSTGSFSTGRILLLLVLLSAGCQLEFNEAVPCENQDQCPRGYICDLVSMFCVSSSETELDLSSESDTIRVIDSGPSDHSGADIHTPEMDLLPIDQDAADDVLHDVSEDIALNNECMGSVEICTDGIDNDCDGEIDNPAECSRCPHGAGPMALVEPEGGTAFCIDLYEASQEDATLSSMGTASTGAYSTSGVIPWSNLSWVGAQGMCEYLDKRLCTITEWQSACSGGTGYIYPYSATTYDPFYCNGNDQGFGYPTTAGSMVNCQSPEGPYDMSGNLAEFVSTQEIMGGAFTSSGEEMRCDSSATAIDLNAPGTEVGFRCCVNAF